MHGSRSRYKRAVSIDVAPLLPKAFHDVSCGCGDSVLLRKLKFCLHSSLGRATSVKRVEYSEKKKSTHQVLLDQICEHDEIKVPL